MVELESEDWWMKSSKARWRGGNGRYACGELWVGWSGSGWFGHSTPWMWPQIPHLLPHPGRRKKESQLHLTSGSFRIGMGQTYNDPKKCYDALKRFLGWSPIYRAISEIFEPMNVRKGQGTCRNEGSLDWDSKALVTSWKPECQALATPWVSMGFALVTATCSGEHWANLGNKLATGT